ncbi:hypothetical protein L7F22_030752 [Adiantum nelumboides]|nr:hypothetical protein [Adiantum nelumboides]
MAEELLEEAWQRIQHVRSLSYFLLFRWDFHLWQAFVACLPSVAIYLTAQYARWDIRRMEAEREREAAEKREIEEKKQDEESYKLPGFRVLHARLDKIEGKIGEMESKTAQSVAALEESKLEKAEKEEKLLKEGNADTSAERRNDTKALKNGIQNPQVTKEDPKDCNMESVKARLKEENLQKQASTTEADQKGKVLAKTREDTSIGK